MKTADASDLTQESLLEMLATIKPIVSASIYVMIEKLVTAFLAIRRLLEGKRVSIRRLLKMVFGAKTEKTDTLLPEDKEPDKDGSSPKGGEDKKKRKGHGRRGVKDYPGAEKIYVHHDSLNKGCQCPSCQKGKLHLVEPGKVLRLVGQAFLKARLWLLERLRCGLCGDIFWAKLPDEAGKDKFNAEAGAMIAILKYGNGLPFNRLQKLLESLGVPASASVQWSVVRDMAAKLGVILDTLLFVAAQAEIIHNDDTKAKVLKVPGASNENESAKPGKKAKKRTGLFTTALVAIVSGIQIALFLTGRKHAGENLNDLLRKRHEGREPVIQMCDGLDHNEPADFDTIVGNCLSHGRRPFVEVIEQFPDECRRVLVDIRAVYRVDAKAKKQGLSKEDRLRLHQAESGPIMNGLKAWCEAQFNEKKVEENSGLGKAINYLLTRWGKLTLFLRQAGAPLDNNLCERVIKMAILHRKNSYFYKTMKGAAVGDLFMSIIHTCQLNGVNPFDYLVAVLKHIDEVQEKPAEWLPWNYREALKGLTPSQSAEETPQTTSTPDHRPDDKPLHTGPELSTALDASSVPEASGGLSEPLPTTGASLERSVDHSCEELPDSRVEPSTTSPEAPSLSPASASLREPDPANLASLEPVADCREEPPDSRVEPSTTRGEVHPLGSADDPREPLPASMRTTTPGSEGTGTLISVNTS